MCKACPTISTELTRTSSTNSNILKKTYSHTHELLAHSRTGTKLKMSGKVFNEKCVITGEPARYRDPVTGQPYATLAAFKILRERFTQQVCSVRLCEACVYSCI